MTTIQEVHEETTTETIKEEKETMNNEEEIPDHDTTLLEEIWINQKQAYHRNSPSKNQLIRKRRPSTRCFPLKYWTTRTYLTSKWQNTSLNHDLGIMPLISRKTLYPKTEKSTCFHPQNKLNWTNSLIKTWQKDISDHQNLLWPPHSSLSIRRMESYDPVRITENSMKELSRMPTLLLLFLLFHTLFHLIHISFPQCADAIIVYHYVLHYIINPESNLALSSCLHWTLGIVFSLTL